VDVHPDSPLNLQLAILDRHVKRTCRGKRIVMKMGIAVLGSELVRRSIEQMAEQKADEVALEAEVSRFPLTPFLNFQSGDTSLVDKTCR